MNFLKIIWQHVFQKKNASSGEEEPFSELVTDFSAEPLSCETMSGLLQEVGFEELAAEGSSIRFRFDGQEVRLESDPEQFALQISELLLEFDPPSFPDEDLELDEVEMQGLDERFWEKYVLDEEGFAKDIPNFAKPEFHSLPFDTLKLDESSS